MKDTDIPTIAEPAADGKPRGPRRAYILRCWREDAAPGRRRAWRFSLEQVSPERYRQGFASLEMLVDFLKAQLGDEGR